MGFQRGRELRLALQDNAVVENLQIIRRQRGACGGDVDNRFRRAGRRRAFGRAKAFDNAVIGDAVCRKEAARQPGIFGGNAKAAVMTHMKGRTHIVKIGHGRNVDPIARHGHHHVGEAEAQRLQHRDARIGVGQRVADQVFAGDPEMDIAFAKGRDDIGRRQKLDLHIGLAHQAGTVFACGLFHDQAGILQIRHRLFLQASFGGKAENKGAHASAPVARRAASTRSSRMAQPTAGIS